jgi:hypothetical protein
VVSSQYLPERDCVQVKVQLDSGRLRTYFADDIRPAVSLLFGPEGVKIKSLSKIKQTDEVALQLEEVRGASFRPRTHAHPCARAHGVRRAARRDLAVVRVTVRWLAGHGRDRRRDADVQNGGRLDNGQRAAA